MKKFLKNKFIILASLALIGISSCSKFEVLSDVDPELVDAGENLKGISIWTLLSTRSDNKGIDTLKSLNLYANAIERVGLRPLLEGDGNFTVIAPRNEAMVNLAISLGYNTVDEVPSAILRNIFLDNIITERVKSFELEPNNIKLFPTVNEDSISFARQPSRTNLYILNLYNAPSLSTSTVEVRSQNLECKNGIVHIVDELKSYKPKFLQPEAAKLKGDTIYVTKDSYINNGSGTNKNRNFGDEQFMWIKKSGSADFSRSAIIQFPVRAPIKFTKNIAGVTLYLHTDRFDPPNGGNSAVLSIYENENVDFNELRTDPADPTTGINFRNAPEQGNLELSSINFVNQNRQDTIVSASVGTNYKAALANGKTFINFGLNTTANALFQILTKETLDNNRVAGKFSAFLVLTPEQITVLVNPINTGIVVDLTKGYKKINTSELSFSGTPNNNITYTFVKKPTNGFVVVDGTANVTTFTQAQLVKGSVKYLYSGTAAGTDSFTVSARDSEGNSFATNQVVSVKIQ